MTMLIAYVLLFAVALANEELKVDQAKLQENAIAKYLRKHRVSAKVTPAIRDRLSFLIDAKYLATPSEEHRVTADTDEEPPEHFDAREKWPECASIIGTIRDQSRCGSCWAVSTAEAMSDRLCIQSGGKIKRLLSDTDILSCCFECGRGCQGGYPLKAFAYGMKKGVCTGGRYKTKGVCKPYAFHPCGFHKNQTYYGDCPTFAWETPKCDDFCRRGYPIPYEKDKYYTTSAYALKNDEKEIRKEIYKNGPVVAGFEVFTDFTNPGDGIYIQHEGVTTNSGHAIKIIGWGEEENVKYWIIANSWNTDWGNKGFFKMIRGNNNCSLEESVWAGMMKVD